MKPLGPAALLLIAVHPVVAAANRRQLPPPNSASTTTTTSRETITLGPPPTTSATSATSTSSTSLDTAVTTTPSTTTTATPTTTSARPTTSAPVTTIISTDSTGEVTITVTSSFSSSSSSASSTPTHSTESGGGSFGTGSIIGVSVAGGIAVIAIIAFFVWKFTRKRFSDFDDNEAIKWPELNAHGGADSHPLPTHNTGRAGFDTGSEADLSRVNSTNYSTADVSTHDPYAVPPLPHMNPNQPYRDDPSAATGYYDPYRGPIPGTLEHGVGVDDYGHEAIPMTQMNGRMSPGPQAAFAPPYNAGRSSPGPYAAYGGRASPGPQAAYNVGRASPAPQTAYGPR